MNFKTLTRWVTHPAQIKPIVNELVMQLYWLFFPSLTNQRIVQELAIYNACQ